MDIAALSMSMAKNNIQSDVGIAMLGKSLDISETMGDAITNMLDRSTMEQSVTPYIGANIDMSV